MEFVITGFGPFAGVPLNPTTALGADAAALLQQRGSALRVTVAPTIEVSLQGAAAALDAIYAPSAAPPRVVIHCGVAPSLGVVHVEGRARNTCSFRVADERGAQPANAPVLARDALGALRHTTLDAPALAAALRARGHAVAPSLDAGSFLCNALYYLSLARAEGAALATHALFVHVPPSAVLPPPAAAAALADLIEEIAAALGRGECAAPAPPQPAPGAAGAAAAADDAGKSGGGGVGAGGGGGGDAGGGAAPAESDERLAATLESLGFEGTAVRGALAALGAAATAEDAVELLLAAGGGDAADARAAAAADAAADARADARSAAAAAPRLKLVIVLRGDVGMSPGKAAAQAAHAALKAARAAPRADAAAWAAAGEPIVVVRAPAVPAATPDGGLSALAAAARAAGVAAAAVRDAGRTQVPAGTMTALAVGPAPEPAVDALTGAFALW